MNIFSIFIRSRIAATVSALLVIAIGCAAGIWQLNRADQKIHLGETMAAMQKLAVLDGNIGAVSLEEANQRRMQVHGRYLLNEVVWLDNRPRPVPEGVGANTAQAGFYVLMPLKLEGSDRVLWVNRGWAPRNHESRTQLPLVNTPERVLTVEGVVFPHPGKVFELGKSDDSLTQPRIVQNLDLAREAQIHGWQQLPFILRASDTDIDDGLVRIWAAPTNGVDRHYAYAFQWFALALCGFLFWFLTGLKQYRRKRKIERQVGVQNE
ncbi:Cytochrome oxidase assembly protein ShyY1 [Polynucleobacter meluiroseus]|uniref:SURF1-like protein n=1 Tax=Polynucleobacter meluiroseus TaxID=1938814 RepID=A0A240DX97_9BURK|nr:SURF1 family protein [Polynucleobacter meluiroseus]SNX27819.1 Cytochrome oxidase assembly protein ShyY1 [Polynucleobacter meluiroseus]